MASPDKKELTLRSTFDSIDKLEPFVDDLKNWGGLDDDLSGNVMLALSEAVTNAIVHGNREDPDKEIVITASIEKKKLVISVQDEGSGFDPSDLPDPLQEDNLLKEGGRGVYLIRQFADEVLFKKGGRQIEMEFRL